jgi:hypothetical protein
MMPKNRNHRKLEVNRRKKIIGKEGNRLGRRDLPAGFPVTANSR